MIDDNQVDLELAGFSALSLLNKSLVKLNCAYYPYSQLKATARFQSENKTLSIKVSDGFSSAGQQVVTGLMIDLFKRLFGIEKISPTAIEYVRAYKEFSKKKTTAEYSNTLHRLRNRQRKLNPIGVLFDLNRIAQEIVENYPDIFSDITIPIVGWSTGNGSRRILAYHERSLGRIVMSKKLDNRKVPLQVIEMVLFHELLHVKLGVKYECGKSMKVRAHTKEFFEFEKKYRNYEFAEHWLKNNRI